jgi:hypothetical protein
MDEPKKKHAGGRPKKPIQVTPPDQTQPVSTQPPVELSMKDRREVENSVRQRVNENKQDRAQIKADTKRTFEALARQIEEQSLKGEVDLSLVRAFEQQQQRFRQICNDEDRANNSEIKQFKLFSQLDKPPEDDPVFTPVTVVVTDEPPPNCLIENIYQLDDDDREQPRSA